MPISPERMEELLHANLGGCNQRFFHWANPKFLYTDGVRELAIEAKCYWLLDLIALFHCEPAIDAYSKGGLTVFDLEVSVRRGGHCVVALKYHDQVISSKIVPHADLPVGSWDFIMGIEQMSADEYPKCVLVLTGEY